MSEAIHFTLNGRPTVLEVDGSRKLLWVLRTELGLTGTKFGCGEGFCGSCTVLVEGKAERSCTLAVEEVAGKEVVTIEGLATNGSLHPVQAAFVEHDALQCGFCTPGFVGAGTALLNSNPNPSLDEIKAGLAGNLCRCGTYPRVFEAVGKAAKGRKG